MFFDLPTEIKAKIFSYDATYHHIFQREVLVQMKKCSHCGYKDRVEIQISALYVFEDNRKPLKKSLAMPWYCCFSCLVQSKIPRPRIWNTESYVFHDFEDLTDGEFDSDED